MPVRVTLVAVSGAPRALKSLTAVPELREESQVKACGDFSDICVVPEKCLLFFWLAEAP